MFLDLIDVLTERDGLISRVLCHILLCTYTLYNKFFTDKPDFPPIIYKSNLLICHHVQQSLPRGTT